MAAERRSGAWLRSLAAHGKLEVEQQRCADAIGAYIVVFNAQFVLYFVNPDMVVPQTEVHIVAKRVTCAKGDFPSQFIIFGIFDITKADAAAEKEAPFAAAWEIVVQVCSVNVHGVVEIKADAP